MQTILNVVVVIIVVYLLVTYLIPMLGVYAGLATIILVVAVIVWLLKISGLWF